MKIETSYLRDALDFLGKAVVVDKTKPMATSLIELSTHKGGLYGYTYDEQNYLRARICDTNEDFIITVSFDLLYGLVKSVGDDMVEITLVDDDRNVKFRASSVTCKLPKYDNVVVHPKTTDCTEFLSIEDFNKYANMSVIRTALNSRHTTPCYSNIYFGETILATDCNNAVLSRKRLFSSDILLPPKSLSILSKLDDFNYCIRKATRGSELFVSSNNKVLYILTADATEYQWSEFMKLFATTGKGSVEISKSNLSKALSTASVLKLERLHFIFNEKGAFLQIKNHDFIYRLSDTPCQNAVYTANAALLGKLLSLGENLLIYYGETNFIRVVGDVYEEVLCMASVT